MRSHIRCIVTIGCTAFLLAACGMKAPPEVVEDLGPPEIVEFKYAMEGNGLRMTFRLQGGAGGIGYQIDRSDIDPQCDCPSFWRRYYEQPPLPGQAGKRQQRTIAVAFSRPLAFRIRAVDGLGRLSDWSAAIRVLAEEH